MSVLGDFELLQAQVKQLIDFSAGPVVDRSIPKDEQVDGLIGGAQNTDRARRGAARL
jgi:hypothetical protein